MTQNLVRVAGIGWAVIVIACGGSDGEQNGAGQKDKSVAKDKSAAAESGSGASQKDKSGAKDESAAAESGSEADESSAGSMSEPRAAGPAAAGRGGSPGMTAVAGTGPSKDTGKKPAEIGVDAGTGTTSDCDAGYTAVAGKCVCDLEGRFALRQQFEVTLSGVIGTEDISGDTMTHWAIVDTKADGAGNLALTLTACGQTSVELCSVGSPPLLPLREAYAQYVPTDVWQKSPVRLATIQMSVADAVPNAAFASPPIAQVLGLTLTDPLGAFPSNYQGIEGTPAFDGSGVNGAKWLDMEGDGRVGFTMFYVPPGGVAANSATGPAESYDASSSTCPRGDPSAQRSPYAYLPGPDGLAVGRVKSLGAGQRVVSELHGTLASCDRITGDLTGPGGERVLYDTLFGECVLVNGSGEKPCSSTLLDLFRTDKTGQNVSVRKGTFVMERVADDVTCPQVRAMKFE